MNNSAVFDVSDKVVVITGACGGIGSAVARGFIAHGARVFAADVPEKKHQVEDGCTFCALDVSATESVAEMASVVVSDAGRVDVLINSAAVVERGLAEELTVDEIERTLRVNLVGTFLCCQSIGKIMINQKAGKIINFGSRAGFIGSPFSLAYNASKAGIVLLTKTLAVEWGVHNIQVNTIVPSLTRTPLAALGGPDPELEAILGGRTPLGRVGEPDDFVGPAIFLASAASNYVSGSAIIVDGGNLASGGIGTEMRDYELRKRKRAANERSG